MYIYLHILKTIALRQASDLIGFPASYAVPSDVSDVLFTGPVDVMLPTGLIQQVFGTLHTATKCIHSMDQRKLYPLSPNEGVTVFNIRSKLLGLENAYINQKMMNSYAFTFHGNQVQAIHRSVADTVSLSEAFASAGFRCIGLPWSTDVKLKMETDRADKDRPRTQVADYQYKSPVLPHTNLVDSSPIIISSV